MTQRLAQFLHATSAWGLLAAMVIAPWLLGTSPPWAIQSILWLLAAVAACWAAALILQRRLPPLNYASLIAAILLAQGWLMTFHPVSQYLYDGHNSRFDFVPHIPHVPGSWDAYSSYLGMLSFTALFAAFHVALDHLTLPTFRRRTLWTAAIAGASVAALGIAQRTGATRFMLDYMTEMEGKPFGPFNYHVAAGAFLLVCFAAAGVTATRAIASGRRHVGILAAGLAAMILAGVFVNQSRTSAALAVALTAALAYAVWRILWPVMTLSRKTRWTAIAVVAGVIVVGAGLSFVLMPAKWHLLFAQLSLSNPRIMLWKIVAGMAKEGGAFGLGPNTFSLAFPISHQFNKELYPLWVVTYHQPGTQVSIWSHAHNDWLQAMVEWGFIGGILWGLLGSLTIHAGIRALTAPGCPAEMRLVLLGGFAGLLSVMAHSMVDFPLQILVLQLYAVAFGAMLWAGARGSEYDRFRN